jgi:hypothetical protein
LQDQYRPKGVAAPGKPVIKENGLTSSVSNEDLEDAIKQYHQKIQTDDIFKFLEMFYIPLEIIENPELTGSIIERSFDLDGDWSESEDLLEEENDDKYNEKIISHHPRHFDNIENLFAQESQFVLLGEAGSGKTTCLQWLLFKKIKKYQSGDKITIYIPLVKFRPGEDLVTLIGYRSGLSIRDINYLLESQRIILLFDSLNECQIQNQEVCARQIQLFINEWPDIPIVLTSRTISWLQNIEFPAFTIQPLTHDQQLDLIKVHLKDKNRADIVLNQLQNQSGGELTANNPWMLFMVASIIKDGKDLPVGRAQIYRRYTQRWYEREAHKAKHAYSFLPWNEDQVFRKLTHIAAHMRLNGYVKEAPVSWITENIDNELVADEKLLHLIGQGLILIIDLENDSLSFFHETIQEYLAAEYILKNPDLFENIPQKDANQFGMILAYAFELGKNPSSKFIEVAWSLNPILVAFVADDIPKICSLPFPKIYGFLKDTLQLLLQLERSFLKDKDFWKLPKPKLEHMHFFNNSALQYIISSNPIAFSRFQTLKADLIKRSPEVLISLIKYHLLNKNDPVDSFDRMRYLESKRIERKPWILYYLAEYDLLQKKDLSERSLTEIVNYIIQNSMLGLLTRFIHLGWIDNEDFSKHDELFSFWIDQATPLRADILIRAGLLCKNNFEHRKPIWLQQIPGNTNKKIKHLRAITKTEIFSNNDYRSLAKKVSLSQAIIIIEAGFAVKEDFEERISGWIKQANPTEAKILIGVGFADSKDFTQKITTWIKNASPSRAKILIEYGFAKEEDFEGYLSKWIEKATLKRAKYLIEYGYAKKEDFEERKPQWIKNATLKNAKLLINIGLANKNDFIHCKPIWIEQFNNIRDRRKKVKLLKVMKNMDLFTEKDRKKLTDSLHIMPRL